MTDITSPLHPVNHSSLVALGWLAVLLFIIWWCVKKGDDNE